MLHRTAVRLLLCLFLATSFTLTAQARTGTIEYPLDSLLQGNQGTLEFWFRTDLDLEPFLPSTHKYVGLFTILSLRGSDGQLQLRHAAGATHRPAAGLHLTMRAAAADVPALTVGPFLPESGQWHHLALVWEGPTYRLYLDGELSGTVTGTTDLAAILGDLANGQLRFGDRWGKRGRFAIDDLRFSDIARQPDSLGFHGELTPDPYTILLDPFDTPFTCNGQRTTRPLVRLDTEIGGCPSTGCAFIEGKFGQAIALFSPAAE